MAERKWTDEQKNAVESRNGTVVVSAAAGSGKTSVLVERIVRRLTDEKDPVSPDGLLVVTFTNAAASEMRVRIEGRLRELRGVAGRHGHLVAVPGKQNSQRSAPAAESYDCDLAHDILSHSFVPLPKDSLFSSPLRILPMLLRCLKIRIAAMISPSAPISWKQPLRTLRSSVLSSWPRW